jgi:hypothetical protein
VCSLLIYYSLSIFLSLVICYFFFLNGVSLLIFHILFVIVPILTMCYLSLLKSDVRTKVKNTLYNLYGYYSQFLPVYVLTKSQYPFMFIGLLLPPPLCFDLFLNVCSLSLLFGVRLEATVKKELTPIEQKLKDFIKLSKWEDSDHYRLQKSAETSHRTLNKFMRNVEVSSKFTTSFLLSNYSHFFLILFELFITIFLEYSRSTNVHHIFETIWQN